MNSDEQWEHIYGFGQNFVQEFTAAKDFVGDVWKDIYEDLSSAYHRKLRKDKADIKSEDFKEFLENKGQTPSEWKKVMETWETADEDIYERHYWTNETDSYYHD